MFFHFHHFQQHHQQQQTPLLVTGGTRRQLTPAQQTHILSDIQQHQRIASQNQLLSPTQNQKVFGQKIVHNVLIEPSVQSQLPTETTILQYQPGQNPFFLSQSIPQQQAQQQNRFRTPNNLRSNELHAQHHTQSNFISNFNGQPNVVFPQQPLFERNQQQVFQRSVANQQGDANHIFRPSQPFPVIPPAPVHPSSGEQSFNQQPLQPVQTLQNQIHQNQAHQNHSPNPPPNVQFIQNHGLPPLPAANQQFPQFQNPQVHFAQQAPPPNAPQFFNEQDPRYKEFVERQKVIQKHEHFVQRNHEKQQMKVRQLHQDFVQQQRRIKEQSIVNLKHKVQQPPPNTQNFFPPPNRSRLVSPYEIGTFERAVQNYQHNYPTQPTSTPYPVTESETAAVAASTTRLKSSRANVKGDVSEDELERLLLQHRDKLYTQLKQDENKTTKKIKVKPTKALGRDDLLKQLKLALADQPADLGNSNYTTMDLVLPNGQKVQVIRTTDPNLVKGATPLNSDGTILTEQSGRPEAEQKPLIEQAADSGLIPPGSNFEVIRQSSDGSLQPVDNLSNKKKVTFVYLEEQNDGSYKVQGVKANGEREAKTNGVEVDSIIDRIKNGEIQLPPRNVRRNTVAPSTSIVNSSPAVSSTSYVTNNVYDSSSPSTHYMTSATPSPTFSFVSSASPYSTLSTDPTEDQENLLTASPSSHYPTSTPRSLPSRSIYTTRSLSTTYSDNHLSSTAQQQSISASSSTISQVQTQTTMPPIETTTTQSTELINILKNSGLHAMAKYLRQSGLDTILNETGPYTVFAPSDKAFKNLLVQLGGPDRAEEKFKSNPRLLSGVSLNCFLFFFFLF